MGFGSQQEEGRWWDMLGDAAGWGVTAPALLSCPTERSEGKASRPGLFSAPQGMRGSPRRAPRCPRGSPPSARANLCSPPHLLCGFEEFGGVFPRTHHLGVSCFYYCFLLKTLVPFIPTATGAKTPSPSSPRCGPAADPKTCPGQSSGFSRTRHNAGSKRAWGQGTETHGDPEERQQRGESQEFAKPQPPAGVVCTLPPLFGWKKRAEPSRHKPAGLGA